MKRTKENSMDIKQGYWFNYKTGEYEYIETPKEFTDYIPQDEAVQAAYKLYQKVKGLSPLLAAKEVLKRYVGEKQG